MRRYAAFALLLLTVTVGSASGGGVRPSCAAGVLAAHVHFQAATGSLLGGFTLKNRGAGTCMIGGRPQLALYRADGRPVSLRVALGDHDKRFPPYPRTTMLRPHQSATAWILWTSYCGSLWQRPFTFRATMTTDVSVAARTVANVGISCAEYGGGGRPGPGRARLELTAFRSPR